METNISEVQNLGFAAPKTLRGAPLVALPNTTLLNTNSTVKIAACSLRAAVWPHLVYSELHLALMRLLYIMQE